MSHYIRIIILMRISVFIKTVNRIRCIMQSIINYTVNVHDASLKSVWEGFEWMIRYNEKKLIKKNSMKFFHNRDQHFKSFIHFSFSFSTYIGAMFSVRENLLFLSSFLFSFSLIPISVFRQNCESIFSNKSLNLCKKKSSRTYACKYMSEFGTE